MTSEELENLNASFEQATPEQILGWAAATFPTGMILTCSFQHEGVVLAHMLRAIKPETPVVFINTRFHFKETIEYRDTIAKLFGLNLQVIEPEIPFDEFKRRYGADLNQRDPDLCCKINKVDPLLRALQGVKAWVNGRRRDQTPERAKMGIVDRQGEIIKINPMANWTAKDTFRYMNAHNIPLHPLFEKGYTSIGCEPCTALPLSEGDERSGRWAGSGKRECGIHTIMSDTADPTGGD